MKRLSTYMYSVKSIRVHHALFQGDIVLNIHCTLYYAQCIYNIIDRNPSVVYSLVSEEFRKSNVGLCKAKTLELV